MKHTFFLVATVCALTFGHSLSAKGQWVKMSCYGGGYDVTDLVGSGSDVFAAFYDGSLNISTDNGASWPIGYPSGGVLKYIAFDGRYLLGSGQTNGIFASPDTGKSWKEADYNFEYMDVNALAVIGTNFFAATENGVYLLTDSDIIGGFAWTKPD